MFSQNSLKLCQFLFYGVEFLFDDHRNVMDIGNSDAVFSLFGIYGDTNEQVDDGEAASQNEQSE